MLHGDEVIIHNSYRRPVVTCHHLRNSTQTNYMWCVMCYEFISVFCSQEARTKYNYFPLFHILAKHTNTANDTNGTNDTNGNTI